MDTTGYTYTSTTTDANGNVVSETKKSSTKTGGTEKVQHTEKFPYVTYYDQNIALDRDRYVGEPGKVEERSNAIGLQTLEPGKNIRKDSGVLNMSEKDFSLLELINNNGKGLPGTREATQKLLLPKANKEKLTASEWKDLFTTIKSKPTTKTMNNFYKISQKERDEKKSLGYKIGNVISGDASCSDFSKHKSLDLPETMIFDRRMTKEVSRLTPEEKELLEKEYGKLVSERNELVKNFPQKHGAWSKDLAIDALVGGLPYRVYLASRDAASVAAGRMRYPDLYHVVDNKTLKAVNQLEKEYVTKRNNLFKDARKRSKELRF